MNIIIPMAGLGSRFADAGYELPKPFIDVDGKPMISRVMDNLSHKGANFILLANEQHLQRFPDMVQEISRLYPVTFIPVSKTTEGTACTVLYARKALDLSGPVAVANSDQIVDIDFQDFISDAEVRNLDGSIMTFIDEERNPKWSFAELNAEKLVKRVREKEPISEFATVGIYYFNKAFSLLDAIIQMVIENERVNNEFYICPVYNYLIRDGLKIGIFNIENYQMHGIGTPADLSSYLLKN